MFSMLLCYKYAIQTKPFLSPFVTSLLLARYKLHCRWLIINQKENFHLVIGKHPSYFERVMCPRYAQASIFTLVAFFNLPISENKIEKRTLFLYVL